MSAPTMQGRALAITGGTGTFGVAAMLRALDEDASRVVIISRDETKHARVAALLAQNPRRARVRFMLGDVRDEARMAHAFAGCDLVLHAAAMKRIEACEAHPAEAFTANVLGTHAVAGACISAHVRRAVFLSTDKACAPTTVYGTTKLMAERLWGGANVYAAGRGTTFVATRYGNVLGSTGSVVPLWLDLLARNPDAVLPVTDPTMTRFVMTKRDALDLVWYAATSDAVGGEVFVPSLAACTLDTLARACGGRDVHTHVVGTRGIEKRHEELLTPDECARACYDRTTHRYVLPAAATPWVTTKRPLYVNWLTTLVSYRSDDPQRHASVADVRALLVAGGCV